VEPKKDEVKDKAGSHRKSKHDEDSDSPEHKVAKDKASGDAPHEKVSAEVSEAVAKAKAKFNDQLLAVDNEETNLFHEWMNKIKEARAEQERWRVLYEQENVVVGPSLPESVMGTMGRADYGGALLPGEGDRWVSDTTRAMYLNPGRGDGSSLFHLFPSVPKPVFLRVEWQHMSRAASVSPAEERWASPLIRFPSLRTSGTL